MIQEDRINPAGLLMFEESYILPIHTATQHTGQEVCACNLMHHGGRIDSLESRQLVNHEYLPSDGDGGGIGWYPFALLPLTFGITLLRVITWS